MEKEIKAKTSKDRQSEQNNRHAGKNNLNAMTGIMRDNLVVSKGSGAGVSAVTDWEIGNS